jgi:hypothetical protein
MITSIMTQACPTWDYAADNQFLKLQLLENRILRAVRNLYRCTPVRKMYVTLKIHYVCGYITKLCMTQKNVVLKHDHPNVRDTGQG